ncbi:uncharacterized protein LOC117648449 [Thrips palmi]|uniref:Uncharacterized protein LOC117648449 n=1 Tax=Thrips palmi TaxID=161013 RepID=A0A6P8ZR21_THRPL|nr:uncharacterized protein LOC117648449 [Thrips palmi]
MAVRGADGADSHRRVRRQNGEVVESIFQIPISTLQAVSKAFTTGIQTFQRGREQFYQASRPTGGGLNAAYNYQNGLSSINYQQSSKPSAAYSPYKPAYNAYKPASGASSSAAYSQAYAVLNRPGYVLYNYNRPRAAGQSQAASVAGVAPQSDGSSYRI